MKTLKDICCDLYKTTSGIFHNDNCTTKTTNDTFIDVFPEVEIAETKQHYCWCCGYPSDDLQEMVLEDARRQKHTCIICGICLDSPWVLDSWLNQWNYSPETRAILASMAFIGNRIIDSIKK